MNGACDNGWCNSKNGSGRYHVSDQRKRSWVLPDFIKPFGVSYSGASYKYTVFDTTGQRSAAQGLCFRLWSTIVLTCSLKLASSLRQHTKPSSPLTRTSGWGVQITISRIFSSDRLSNQRIILSIWKAWSRIPKLSSTPHRARIAHGEGNYICARASGFLGWRWRSWWLLFCLPWLSSFYISMRRWARLSWINNFFFTNFLSYREKTNLNGAGRLTTSTSMRYDFSMGFVLCKSSRFLSQTIRLLYYRL